jgi:tetratricopeptide (TPR) repeat protein
MRRACRRIAVVAMIFGMVPLAHAQKPVRAQERGMQITTKSAKARALFQDAMHKEETLHLQAALESFRNATQADPNCAVMHMFLSYFSPDPAEQVAERDKALATRKFAGREEQLIIDWLANTSQGRVIPAIQAMNEALEQFQQDEHLAWLAGGWLLVQQNQPLRAIPFYERAIKIDPTFADPWNEVAYCYARTGNFEEAFRHIKRYTELLPNEANPQDTFAEISRMAGRYDDALAHYRASLEIDPTFNESQLGLGDTYALMGNESLARAEYTIAIRKASKVQGVLWSLQSAASYVREGDFQGADAAFTAVAEQAHKEEFGNLEAEAYRSMALYPKDPAAAMSALQKAEAVLHENHKVPQTLVDQELASILRTGVARAVRDGNLELANAILKRLQDAAKDSPDAVVQSSLHGASGDVLAAQGKYDEAVSELIEDETRNPLSMCSLALAYEKSGNQKDAEIVARRLAGFNEPTVEQAVVVPEFRKSFAAAKAAQ